MIRISIRTSLFLIVLAVMPLLLIVARPAQSSDLSGFLFSEDCATPCFMGIRAGDQGLTAEEALAILAQHAWVGDISMQAHNAVDWEYMDSWVSWTWSGKQPDFIDATVPGQIGLVQVGSSKQVANIRVQTQLSLEDVIAVFGSPQRTRFVYSLHSATPNRLITRLHPQVQAHTNVRCPLRQSVIARQLVQMVYGAADEVLEGITYLDPDRTFPQYNSTWLEAYPGC